MLGNECYIGQPFFVRNVRAKISFQKIFRSLRLSIGFGKPIRALLRLLWSNFPFRIALITVECKTFLPRWQAQIAFVLSLKFRFLHPVKASCVFQLEEVASVSSLYGSASTCKNPLLILFKVLHILTTDRVFSFRFPRCS